MSAVKYGIKLISYAGQNFDAWIYSGDSVFETTDWEKAQSVLIDYSTRNPKGCYEIQEKK